MTITLHSNPKVHYNDAAKAAIVRIYNRQHSKHPVPTLAIEDDLPATGLLTCNVDPRSYYFDRDAHRAFFYCSAGTGERVPVRLQLCADALVIRRLPADGSWH